VEFELRTLVVIGTDYLCNCKSNYHTITTTTVLEEVSKVIMFMDGLQTQRNGNNSHGPLVQSTYNDIIIQWLILVISKMVIAHIAYFDYKIITNIPLNISMIIKTS